MHNNNKAGWLIVLSVCLVAASRAEHPVAEAQRHQRDAGSAYQAGDIDAFTQSMQRAFELNPASLAARYNLACGYALTGQPARALALLEGLAVAGVDFGMAGDPDLASLHADPRFAALLQELAESAQPVSNSAEFITLQQLGIAPEGIARDPADGRLFFGSMRSGDIFVIDGERQLAKFASVADAQAYAAIGMSVDPERGLLWVAADRFTQAERFDPDAELAPALFAFDLSTGKRRHQHLAPTATSGFNDVAVAPGGDVYVSGSGLFVLRSGASELAKFETSPEAFGSNGLSFDAAGRHLFLTSYPVGIGVVELATGELRFLESPPQWPLYGIDGLYWYDGDLVGVQNGLRPWRLVRIQLDADYARVTGLTVLERGSRPLTPMTGAIDGDRIHTIGMAPPPDNPPAHFPPGMRPLLGLTTILTVPLGQD